MSSLIAPEGPDPVGAVALLGAAGTDHLATFLVLEDALWAATTLGPVVLENVRLRSAELRGCAFCAEVRIRDAGVDAAPPAAVQDREQLPPAVRAALTLADLHLADPHRPPDAEVVASTLGTAGVLETLLACAGFSSAELRIALGQNRAPAGDGVVDRPTGAVPAAAGATAWPQLTTSPLGPGWQPDGVHARVAGAVRALLTAVWSAPEVTPAVRAAWTERSSQLLGVARGDAVHPLLVPSELAGAVDPDRVRRWPTAFGAEEVEVLALAEQVWLDPAGVGPELTGPVRDRVGVAGVVRLVWAVIWTAQLQRLALVLHGRA
jgi:alkylhydroperoxidase family enzyme